MFKNILRQNKKYTWSFNPRMGKEEMISLRTMPVLNFKTNIYYKKGIFDTDSGKTIITDIL